MLQRFLQCLRLVRSRKGICVCKTAIQSCERLQECQWVLNASSMAEYLNATHVKHVLVPRLEHRLNQIC